MTLNQETPSIGVEYQNNQKRHAMHENQEHIRTQYLEP